MEVAESKVSKTNEKSKVNNKKVKRRTIIVLVCLMISALFIFIEYRANYLEMYEIGEDYINILAKDMKYKIFIGGANFLFTFVIVRDNK